MSSMDSAIEFIKTVGGPSAVAALGWWLKTKFTDIKDAAEERMQSHEHQDERRHRQNLVRFAKLNMKLGIDDEMNGGDHELEH